MGMNNPYRETEKERPYEDDCGGHHRRRWYGCHHGYKMICLGFFFVLLIFSGLFFVLMQSQLRDQKVPDHAFGNEQIGGTIRADALLLSPSGVVSERGIHSMSDPPSILANDSFDGAFNAIWNVNSATIDVTQGNPLSNSSAQFTSTSMINASQTIANGTDNSFESVFFVNITNPLSDSFEAEYFVFFINFSNGNHLYYVIDGYFGTGSNIISLSAIPSGGYNTWVGVRVEQIEQDYLVAYGSSIPNIAGYGFLFYSADATEIVHLDDFVLERDPIGITGDGYWRNANYERVQYYVVNATYNVTISPEVNASNTWLVLYLYNEILYENGSVARGYALLQKVIIQVNPVNTSTPWLSKVFALPEDDSVFGSPLVYNFTLDAVAYGSLISNNSYYVTATDTLAGFDIFTVWWVQIAGSIYVDVYKIGGGSAIAVLSILGVGVVKRRSRKQKASRTMRYFCMNHPDDPACKKMNKK